MDNIATTSQPTTAASASAMPLANISTATLVAAMQSSFTSAKFALQQELACGLAVFASTGKVDADTKKKLRDIYVASGWQADTPEGMDYKTTLRRCQIISVLYTHLGRDVVAGWISGMAEGMVINTIIQNIAPLSLHSMDSVLSHCGKVRAAPKAKLPPPITERRAGELVVQPVAVQTPVGGLPEGAHGPLQPSMYGPQEPMYRRAADREEAPMDDTEAKRYSEWLALHGGYPVADMEMLKEGYREIKTEHVAAAIAVTATKQEIVDFAVRLMALAATMLDDTTLADLPKEELDDVTAIPSALLKEHEEGPKTLEEAISSFQEKEKAKALEAAKVSVEPEEEDLEAMKAHQLQESQRLEAEKLAAKQPPQAAAPSRFRKGAAPTKAK